MSRRILDRRVLWWRVLGILLGVALFVAGLAVLTVPHLQRGFIMGIFGLAFGGYLVWSAFMSVRWRHRGLAALSGLAAVAGLAVIGYWSTKAAVETGLEDLNDRPRDHDIASSALVRAQTAGPRALARRAGWLLYPAARVVAVERQPGHGGYRPGGLPNVDYVVTVRVYTWFAIPVTTFEAICGGALLRPAQPWS